LTTKTFQFAGYTLDITRGSLRTAGRDVELRPKSFEVLCYLVENADRVVTREEAIKAVWSNVVVTEESLTHCVSELRQALGGEQQAIIKTVPRRGYRFAAPVTRPVADDVRVQSARDETFGQASVFDIGRRSEPPLPDRPSIAVLPFQNMSGDSAQEYFADGVVEEIITALSRFSSLFVIARNSSFTYKGQAVDVKRVGRELGVRYVLEGSIRKSLDRVRITGQLIDATNGAHLWADRFDGALSDILDLQDHLTANVVNAISPKLEQAEIVRAKRKPTASLDAYDYFLRGMEAFYQDTRESIDEALRFYSRAVELDPEFAAAYGWAGFCYVFRKTRGWMTDRVREIAEAKRLAWKSIQLGKEDAAPLSRGGHTLAYVVGDVSAGIIFVDRARTLNPNLAAAWLSSGWLRVWIGEPDIAIEHFNRFKRMSPLDPLMPDAMSGCAFAHFHAGRYEEAALVAERVLQESPSLHTALRASVASNLLAGRVQEAHEALARLRQIDPELRVSNLGNLTWRRRPEDMAQYVEAMRKAGLPE
jgi:TolB-like protein